MDQDLSLYENIEKCVWKKRCFVYFETTPFTKPVRISSSDKTRNGEWKIRLRRNNIRHEHVRGGRNRWLFFRCCVYTRFLSITVYARTWKMNAFAAYYDDLLFRLDDKSLFKVSFAPSLGMFAINKEIICAKFELHRITGRTCLRVLKRSNGLSFPTLSIVTKSNAWFSGKKEVEQKDWNKQVKLLLWSWKLQRVLIVLSSMKVKNNV